MTDAASAIAELMNRRYENHGAGTSPTTAPRNSTPPVDSSDPSAAALGDDTICIESIAALVCEMLGARMKPRLQLKLRDWPHVLEDADDLGQLAALAFVEAVRQGRIKPDPEIKRHTASSVSAYLWGICNRILIDTLRRNRQTSGQQNVSGIEMPNRSQESSPLQWLLSDTPDDDDESRLWEALAAVRNRCKPQDVVMTYLMGCGFSSGEIQRLLEISINMPAKAIKRVGQAVREALNLDSTPQPEESPAGKRDPQANSGDGSSNGGTEGNGSPVSMLGLLKQKFFTELIQRLDSPPARSTFLREAVAAIGPAGSVAVEQSLADRRYEMRAGGDWSWGLLSKWERRELLLRDARVLRGAGIPDEGAAQRAALNKLVAELGNIFQELDQALLGDDLGWLLPLAEHLHELLGIICEYKEMRKRYRALLDAATRMGSQRLEMLALLGLGTALTNLGEFPEASGALEHAAGLARELDEPRAEGLALSKLANVYSSEGTPSHANELYEQCLPILRAIGDRHAEADALHGLAMNHHVLGEYDSAGKRHSQALEIRREIGDRHGEAQSLNGLGILHSSQGENPAAAENYRAAISIMHELGDRFGEASCLNNLGIVEVGQGSYSVARGLFERALALCQELGVRGGEANCMLELGELACNQGNYAAAKEQLEPALALSQEVGFRRREALCLANLGIVEFMQDSCNAARELLEQALAISREISFRRGEAFSLNNLGTVENWQGNYSAARELHEQALTIYRELGGRYGQAFCLSNLGVVAYNQGDNHATREPCEQALTLFRGLGCGPGIAEACLCAGAAFAAQGRQRSAALAIYGGQHGATRLKHKLGPPEQLLIDAGLASLETAVADGTVTFDEIAAWRTEAEAMSLDDLAQRVLAALAKL